MKLKFVFTLAAACAAVCSCVADETAETADSSENAAAELGIKVPVRPKEKRFFTLPFCRRVEGLGEVKKPNDPAWMSIEEGRFYPLGSSYRAAKGGTVVIAFGNECTATIADGASFATRAQPINTPTRTLVLTGGEVALSLSGNLEPGLFLVTTPAFSVINPAGESKYDYRVKPDGFEADIRCVTGSLELEGRHFSIPAMNAADALTVRSEHDNLQTILYGRSGDCIVRLDRGLVSRDEIQDDGSIKTTVEPATLDWNLSASTRVQITRAVPEVGSRMSVTVMTFDSTGEMCNNFAFAEGRAEANFGEHVIRSKGDNDDFAKRAEEVTTEAAAVETEEVAVEEAPAADNSATNEEASEDDDDDF